MGEGPGWPFDRLIWSLALMTVIKNLGRHNDSEASQIQDSRKSHVRDPEASPVQDSRIFATPRLCRSKIPKNRECFAPEKHILRIWLNSTFRGWRVFLNSPTSGCKERGSTISGGSTQYFQLRVYIDCNSNNCPVATEGVVQYLVEALNICNSECT
jgi:hypothetical protein